MTQERIAVCDMSASEIVSESMRNSKEYGTHWKLNMNQRQVSTVEISGGH